MATSGFHFCVLIFCLITLIPTISFAKICLPRNHTALFVFGDSLLGIGNNNYINTSISFEANIYPYGQTFFKYPTGRFSDGRVIPDFLAEYAKLPLALPYLHPGYQDYVDGANFASAGAGALAETRKGQLASSRPMTEDDVLAKAEGKPHTAGAAELASRDSRESREVGFLLFWHFNTHAAAELSWVSKLQAIVFLSQFSQREDISLLLQNHFVRLLVFRRYYTSS